MFFLTKILLIVFVISVLSSYGQSYINSKPESDTSISVIQFMNIPWGTPKEDVLDYLKESSLHIQNIEEEKYPYEDFISGSISPSYNFHDAFSLYYPLQFSIDVHTTMVKMRVSNTIAGYSVDRIVLCFMDENDYGLYKVIYSFSPLTDKSVFSYDEQYADLLNKLSSLYGVSHEHSEEKKGVIAKKEKITSALWLGGKNTGVCLTMHQYDQAGYWDRFLSDEITITYGTADVNSIFELKNKQREDAEEDSRKTEIDRIQNDNFGL
ncbi:MAG: hypothetical protein IKN04_13550 [Clostridia bacterium]|nr:hypothetical protein [Clostridia bacterium]